MAAIEAHHKINTGEIVSCSEQQLLDCLHSVPGDCTGGDIGGAYQVLEGFYRSETEPSEVQDQPIMKAEEPPDGNQSDEEDPQDGNQSTNSGHSRESASCEKVVRILAEVIHSCFARNTAIPAHIQADVPLAAHHNPYGEDRGMEPPVQVLMQPSEAASSNRTPSALPEASDDQALRSLFIPQKQEDHANRGMAINSETMLWNDE